MPEPERKYVRVYYSVVNDERFADVYHDARHFGTWVQLLLVADAMYPADAPVPAYVARASFRVLVQCGLIEERPHQHYRLHGLASEREMRSQSGRIASAARWQSGRIADPMPRQDEHRQDKNETRQDEQADALAEVTTWLELRTGRPWGYRPGSQVWAALEPDVRDFGAQAVVAAMEQAAMEHAHPDTGQLVFGAARILHPIGNGKAKAAGGHTRTAQEVEDAFNR